MKGVRGHRRLPPPGWEDILAEAKVAGSTPEVAARKLLSMRAEEIAREKADPLRFGFEPPIWKVCDALLGFEYCLDQAFLARYRRWLGERGEQADKLSDEELWGDFCARMRQRLGFERPVKLLLVMGGNRAAKSEYAAKRCMMVISQKENGRVFAMHMSDPRSVRDQQPLFWKYMPPEWRAQVAGETAYIKYKRKTGFSENSFITPIGSEGTFLNYMQDRDTALQGIEGDLIAPDELIPADWVDDISLRLATRAGKGILTFTPINGYTPTVKIFCDGAQVVKTVRACLCPTDGGAWDEAAALGLSQAQYEEIQRAEDKKRVCMAPLSVPEDCLGWLDDAGARPAAAGRRFEELPRVLRCVDPRKAVVFFNPSDNPYGNPREVLADCRKKTRVYVRERFYGQAEKTISVMIPRWNRAVHLVKAAHIPERGTDYMFLDPASDRNYFMSWFRVLGKDVYLRREWPGRYFIPGVGVPGPWAIPSGARDGRNDGAPGEGAKPSFGFGNLRYKFEMARLEGWQDFEAWKQAAGPAEYPPEDELADWDERNGAQEVMEARFIDSRAASAPRIENDRPVTLQTVFDELNVFFFLTPGGDISDGVSKINSALDFEGEMVDGVWRFVQAPHFFVCDECENTLYAIENWMNADGQKGACKDPVDLIRYFFMAQCEDVGGLRLQARGGTSYGRNGGGARAGDARVVRDGQARLGRWR